MAPTPAPDLEPTASARPKAGPTAGVEADVEAPRARRSPTDLLALQRVAGNGAVTGLLASRSPQVQRAPLSAADVGRMRAAEARLDGIASTVMNQTTRLGSLNDACVGDLKASKDHLRLSNDNYKAGYAIFKGVLAKADKEYAFDKGVEDAVQGILIAAAFSAVAPEAILLGAAMRGMASSTSSTLTTIGLKALTSPTAMKVAEGGVGSVIELGAGKGVDAVKPGSDPGRPSDSAALAGDTAGDRFEQAFGQLDAMISKIPELGGLIASHGFVAVAATQVGKDALKLRVGDPAQWTPDDIEDKAEALEELVKKGDTAIAKVEGLAANLAVMRAQVVGVKALSPVEVEDKLWTQFMASLSGDAHNMLDNDVLEEYLGPKGKGLFDFGSYTSDADTQDAVRKAQLKFLTEAGITPGTNVDTQYQTQMKLNEIRRNVVGRPGSISRPGTIDVGGRAFRCPGDVGQSPAGTLVVALHVTPPTGYLEGTVNVAHVNDADFEVHANTKASQDEANARLAESMAL